MTCKKNGVMKNIKCLMTFQTSYSSFNFQKNSWWNKKNHQPGLKFDFI
ncbi:hypothetical protein [Spiroplasma endosymbiont of Zeiraphera isertana]